MLPSRIGGLVRDSWARKSANGDTFRKEASSECVRIVRRTSLDSQQLFQDGGTSAQSSPYHPGACHSVAGGETVTIGRQARRSSHTSQYQRQQRKKGRTVHAKDQMSLARVDGGLTEWTPTSNMGSGAQRCSKEARRAVLL